MDALHLQPVIDCDGHILERDRELYEYLPPPFAGVTRIRISPRTDGEYSQPNPGTPRSAGSVTSADPDVENDWTSVVT